MGQKVHPTGLRLGIGQGWDSSWSPTLRQNSQQYRDVLHIDIEIRNLIIQLFSANNCYVGNIAISKNAKLNIIDINLFGYIPSFKRSLKLKSKNISAKEDLEYKLSKLIDVLNKKYPLNVFVLRSILAEEFPLGNQSRFSKFNKKSPKLPLVLKKASNKLVTLSRSPYFSTLLNLVYLVFKIKQPQLLATFIARELSKTRNQRWVFGNVNRVCSFFFTELSDLDGIRIQICGRMNKSKRTQRFVTQYGRIPNQTISYAVQYGTDDAYTTYGSMGVKVWIAYK
jgi:ribosomal protein S3